MSQQQNSFDYIETKAFPFLPVIEIRDVKSFVKFADGNQVKYIFKIAVGEATEFFFPINGIVYKLSTDGFQTLQDMQQAQTGEFPTAAEYYEAQKSGFGSHQELLALRGTGTDTKHDYEVAVKAGFIAGFSEFKKRYEYYRNFTLKDIIPDNIDNPVRLHKYAVSKGIATYDDFAKIYGAGFPDQLSYDDAKLKGFSDSHSYFEAIKKGFSEAAEYRIAESMRIETKKEYDEYYRLVVANRGRNYAFDELELLIALSNIENGSVISIFEIKKMLQNVEEKLKKEKGTGKHILPMWYTRKLDKEEDLVKFLKENEELQKFGLFNKEKNSFEILKASAIKI